MIAEQETAVRNALLAARASIDAALALLSTQSVPMDWVRTAAPTTVPGVRTAPSGMGQPKPVQAAPCAHPPAARQAAGGFGTTATGRFFCRACEQMVEA